LNFVTGWEFTKEDFLNTGERIFNLKRLYNVIERELVEKRILCGRSAGDNLPFLIEMLRDYYCVQRE